MKIEDLQSEQLQTAAEMLKAIAHPIRMSILGILEDEKKLSVTEIHEKINIEQSTASHHLGILKDKGVLCSERVGKKTYYKLKHNRLSNIISCVGSCVIE